MSLKQLMARYLLLEEGFTCSSEEIKANIKMAVEAHGSEEKLKQALIEYISTAEENL